ncbi:GntR family transcriptional regulator [Pseudarthrobacter sulfonivorans]|uniref:GntR family transcriptional regulator n=1 Tax=Pseudarthrobacter sulfonivorans TaxID=121292 RepID=UPI00285C61BD|nr:GntR family transcriptional regulator [Pseudarthrobacter sulfonivorans]MDR6416362.1 DNA-binding FadR family transcriptional regulator [Pseudarthrobacter sulfonivorans]
MTTWREQLAFAPLATFDRGEEVGRRLRYAIELGVLEDGTQLPSENELAAKMGVSTLTLRAALAELRGRGLLETRRGKGGGSFVKASTGDIIKAERESIMAYSLDDLRDIRDYWAFLAGSAAAAAAERSGRLSLARLASMAVKIESAEDSAQAIRDDSRFHIELAASSGSVRLTREEMAMQAEVGPLIWAAPAGYGDAASEHVAIVEAIRSGDRARARALAEDHVRADMNRVLDLRMSVDASRKESFPDPVKEEREVALIESFSELLADTASSSIRSIEDAVRVQLGSKREADSSALDAIYDVSRRTLEGNVALLYGAGFLPDTSFGHAGVAWCHAPTGPQSLQRLVIDWDLYDIGTVAWRPEHYGDGTVHISHAYLDANGSNENVLTFSKAVFVEEEMVGIVAADVLVRGIQSHLEPHLRALPPNTCLVDQQDAIIATNTGRFMGGTYSAGQYAGKQIDLHAMPWRLFVGTPTAGPTGE